MCYRIASRPPYMTATPMIHFRLSSSLAAAATRFGSKANFLWSFLSGAETPMFLGHWARLDLPDLGCIFGDGAIAGKFPGGRHIQNSLAGPFVRVGIALA